MHNTVYNGTVREKIVHKKISIPKKLKEICIWLVGVLLSLHPYFIDAFHYLRNNKELDIKFYVTCFDKGDVLWISCTILLLSMSGLIMRKGLRGLGILYKILLAIASIISLLLAGACFASRYDNAATNAEFVIYLTGIGFFLALALSTPLQLAAVEG